MFKEQIINNSTQVSKTFSRPKKTSGNQYLGHMLALISHHYLAFSERKLQLSLIVKFHIRKEKKLAYIFFFWNVMGIDFQEMHLPISLRYIVLHISMDP